VAAAGVGVVGVVVVVVVEEVVVVWEEELEDEHEAHLRNIAP